MEHAFGLSEASVKLVGIDSRVYPQYAELKKRVMAGELRSHQALDQLLRGQRRSEANTAAA